MATLTLQNVLLGGNTETANSISADVVVVRNCSILNCTRLFSGCDIRVVRFEGCDFTSVTSCDRMFAGCSRLESVTFDNINAKHLHSMRAMFKDCSSLLSLDLANVDTSMVINFKSMFMNCSSLTTLDVSYLNLASAKNVDYMFTGCTNLSELHLPELTVRGEEMFGVDNERIGFSQEQTVIYASNDITSFLNEFIIISTGDTITVSCHEKKMLDTDEFNSYLTSSDGSIKAVDFNSKHISVPEHIKSISFIDCTIHNCSNLFDGEAIEAVSFENCTFDTSESKRMFRNCKQLTSVDMDMRNFILATEMFSGCLSLTDVHLGDTNSLRSIYKMFTNCSSLRELKISCKPTNVYRAFDGCTSMEMLDLADLDFSNVNVTRNLFGDFDTALGSSNESVCLKYNGEVTVGELLTIVNQLPFIVQRVDDGVHIRSERLYEYAIDRDDVSRSIILNPSYDQHVDADIEVSAVTKINGKRDSYRVDANVIISRADPFTIHDEVTTAKKWLSLGVGKLFSTDAQLQIHPSWQPEATSFSEITEDELDFEYGGNEYDRYLEVDIGLPDALSTTAYLFCKYTKDDVDDVLVTYVFNVLAAQK